MELAHICLRILTTFQTLQVFSYSQGYRIRHSRDKKGELSSIDFSEFESFVHHVLSCRKVPGAGIAMVKDNHVLYTEGFGFADIKSKKKATRHTKFCIGSLTKAFTSTLLARLLSQKDNIDWDTPIKDILKDNFRLSDDLRTNHVNLRDVLAHKVGIPENFHALLVGFSEDVTREDFVRRLQFIPATKWFRSKFLYSNYMYTLAGHVAEVLGGRNWETLVQESLLTPLRMHNTGFVDQLDNRNDLASPYVLLNGSLTEVDRQLLLSVHPAGPAGSIYSTPVDMSKWILFHLNRGNDPNGRSIVSEEWLNETYIVQMPQPFSSKDLYRPQFPIDKVVIGYNMGWATSVYRGFRKIWHSGGIVTYTSHLWLFPEKNTGVFVTFNGPLSDESSFAMEAIIGRAADLLLGEEPWMNLTTACTFPSPWRQAKDPRHPWDEKVHKWNISRSHIDYIGVYGHLAFGNISVGTENEKELTLRFGRFGEMNIWPVSETRFHGRYTGSLWFITGSQDNVDPIEIDFVASEAGYLDGLLFPVDFKSNKTLFERDLTLNSDRKWHISNYQVCDSGSKLVSVRTYLLILLYIIFIHFHNF